MKRYLLDTNAVRDFLRGRAGMDVKMMTLPHERIFLSAIVAAELLYGIVRRPEAHSLNAAIKHFIDQVEILPWDADVARVWADFRTSLEKSGQMLTPHDMQIAAHAIAMDMVLVSNDRAFEGIEGLQLENWVV